MLALFNLILCDCATMREVKAVTNNQAVATGTLLLEFGPLCCYYIVPN